MDTDHLCKVLADYAKALGLLTYETDAERQAFADGYERAVASGFDLPMEAYQSGYDDGRLDGFAAGRESGYEAGYDSAREYP